MERINLIGSLLAVAAVFVASTCPADEPSQEFPTQPAYSSTPVKLALPSLAAESVVAATARPQENEAIPHGGWLDPSRLLVRATLIGFLPITERSGLRISLANDQGFAMDGTYFIHANFGVNALAAFLTTDVSSTRARAPTGTSSLGSQHLLPLILTAQYHFCPECRVRPYLGVGIGALIPLNESGNLKLVQPRVAKEIGPAAQAGLDYMINRHFSLNLDVKFLRVDTVAKTSGIVTVRGGLRVDAFFLGGGFGYRF